ncbi:MAG: MFS transporter [Chloroflexi bacterium]|nr:MFS transporter [Chloroflexota bacterium]
MNPEEPKSEEQSAAVAEAVDITGGGSRFSVKNTFASLRYRNFTLLWIGQMTHAFALWLEQTARPLLILAMTDSAIHLGAVILVRTIPGLFLGMIAGVVADNFNRRTVLVVVKFLVLGLNAIFAFLVVTNLIEIWHIYAFSFLRGGIMAFDQPARRAMIPALVPPHLVTNAMALSTSTMGGMRIAGASLAGILMGVFGLAAPFLFIVPIYIVAVVVTVMLRVPDHQRSGYQGMRRMGGDLGQGFKYAWNAPTIRGVLIISLGYFTFGMAFMQVFAPLFATRVLDIGATGYGLLISVMGIGSLAGGLALATLNPTRKRGVLAMVVMAIFGLLLILFSSSTYLNSVPLAFVIIVAIGAGQSIFMPIINTVIIQAAPENMRGRMMGVLSLDRAMTAFGGFVAGMAAAALGVQVAQILFGIGCILIAAIMYLAYPPLRRIE